MAGAVSTFNATQIDDIISKVVPLIADEKDHEFFRGILFVRAEACNSSAEFALVIKSLLEA